MRPFRGGSPTAGRLPPPALSGESIEPVLALPVGLFRLWRASILSRSLTASAPAAPSGTGRTVFARANRRRCPKRRLWW